MLVLFLAQIYGAISGQFIVPATLLLTLNLVIALVLFETFVHFITKRVSRATGSPLAAGPRARDVILRCIRVAVYIGAGTIIAETWIVDIVGLVDRGQWQTNTLTALKVGGAGFLAYVCWQVINF